jgi:hypothetical protein
MKQSKKPNDRRNLVVRDMILACKAEAMRHRNNRRRSQRAAKELWDY